MDREKVIKGLETIKQFFGYGLPSTAEMFDSYYGILNDAIALLTEQESVAPTWICGKPSCCNCGQRIHSGYYCCPYCGRKIKWT